MDWSTSITVADLDFFLVLLFGLGFLHKSWVEYDIAHVSSLLTREEDRTHLGNTFRTKTKSLALFVGILGLVFIIRAWPGFEENRLIVLLIRASAFGAFIWNQIWCWKMRLELRGRLYNVNHNLPTDGQERML